MTDKRPLDDKELDALFADANTHRPGPSDDLMLRVLADAATVQETFGGQIAQASPIQGGFLSRILDGVGGWPALAGLSAAAVVGVGIGFAGTDTLDDLTGGVLASATGGYGLDALLPSYGDLLGEG